MIGGEPFNEMTSIVHIVVAPRYFQTLGIPLLQGRYFTVADYEAPQIVIVSNSFAKKYWTNESPLGKRMRFGPPANNEPWHTVVGVVADYKHGALKGRDWSNVYLPYQKNIIPSSIVIRSSADPHLLAQAIRARISRVDRDIAIGRTPNTGRHH
jgi:putative ABC transport system permease protein